MLFDRMSDEDVMCLHEFMDAGNGEAMYESVEGGMEGIHSADEYVALLKKSVDAGVTAPQKNWRVCMRKGSVYCSMGTSSSYPPTKKNRANTTGLPKS